MTIEEERMHLREENTFLHEQLAQRDERIQQLEAALDQQHILAQRDERIQQLEAALDQQHVLTQQMQEQIGSLTQQVKALQERQAKDSHNSSLPPSSDRFTHQRKSLRKKSEKKAGGQE